MDAKSKSLFGRVVALRVLAGLVRAIRRQICNTDLSGCNIRPVGKNIAFKFCLFSATLNSESSFFRTTRRGLNSEGSCFVNPDGSEIGGILFCQSGRVSFFPFRMGLNSEGSTRCQSGRVKFFQFGRVIFCQCGGVPIRKGSVVFCNPLGSFFLPIRNSPTLVNPEGFQFEGVLFLSIGRGPRKVFF